MELKNLLQSGNFRQGWIVLHEVGIHGLRRIQRIPRGHDRVGPLREIIKLISEESQSFLVGSGGCGHGHLT